LNQLSSEGNISQLIYLIDAITFSCSIGFYLNTGFSGCMIFKWTPKSQLGFYYPSSKAYLQWFIHCLEDLLKYIYSENSGFLKWLNNYHSLSCFHLISSHNNFNHMNFHTKHNYLFINYFRSIFISLNL
jgi:hypothetical protein